MEFVDEEDHEEEEEEDDPVPITTFDPLKMPPTHSSSSSPPPSPLSLSIPPAKKPSTPSRYRECQKNHAVGIGGHAVDGCGEFMPAGAEHSIESLRCAACGCHRNFHRKEPEPANPQQPVAAPIAFYPSRQAPPPGPSGFQFQAYGRQRPPMSTSLSLPPPPAPAPEREMMMISDPMAAMGLGSSGKKRYRTKFTPDQKEKMLQLAEKIGWRLQKQDEEAVQEFCQETGLKRKVLKVWMHNNKQTYLGKKP